MNKELVPYMKDRSFLLAKRSIITTLTEELIDLQHWMLSQKQAFEWLEDVQATGKVSRGENYRGLPYLMLDVPKVFKGADVFSLRTLFWWGNEFSVTLHVSGVYQEKLSASLIQKIPHFKGNTVYCCVNDTPWEYHFEEDNYRAVAEMEEQQLVETIHQHKFLKLSRKLPLNQHSQLTDFAKESFSLFLT